MTNAPAIAPQDIEKYSSAITLSDMEIFVFPELLYSLVLANIMSPRLWAWRDDPWFAGIEKKTPYRRIMRLKQYIIDRYEFNLDLDTWGLTTQAREIKRFAPHMDEATISRSNALFGYEGDKYYFDLDIRRHFGLDRYTTDAIPYWKTETIEAMDAFRFREGYRTGAGECVSLSTLYAAALFVVCRIPLEDIFLLATPLHSQNYVDVDDGILTNNRRVVTKNMWFNGTELSAKAQRALRNEQVTIVAHNTGLVHTVYPRATIDPAAFERFRSRLRAFLCTGVDMEILANYLRQNSALQKCFQIRHDFGGRPRYIPAERVYGYEHSSPYKVSDNTRGKLLDEIDEDEFFPVMLDGRIPLDQFDAFFRENHIDLEREEDVERLKREFTCHNAKAADIVEDIKSFVCLHPRLPDDDPPKTFDPGPVIELSADMTRGEVVDALEAMRSANPTADLAFYALRDLSRCAWPPFLKAAVERNPVAIAATQDLDDHAVIERICALEDASIYDGPRLAQPDEVWNYRRGDGLEKAVCLATIWMARHPRANPAIRSRNGQVTLSAPDLNVLLPTEKGIDADLSLGVP